MRLLFLSPLLSICLFPSFSFSCFPICYSFNSFLLSFLIFLSSHSYLILSLFLLHIIFFVLSLPSNKFSSQIFPSLFRFYILFPLFRSITANLLPILVFFPLSTDVFLFSFFFFSFYLFPFFSFSLFLFSCFSFFFALPLFLSLFFCNFLFTFNCFSFSYKMAKFKECVCVFVWVCVCVFSTMIFLLIHFIFSPRTKLKVRH